MSFVTSLSGLKAAQTDLSVISNNIANSASIGFKQSKASFGDMVAASPNQNTNNIAGQGVQLSDVAQQFTQGSLEATDRTLDLAIAGDGFFVVKAQPPRSDTSYSRNGSFAVNNNREVVDALGNKAQLLPVGADGLVTATDPASMSDFVLPETDPADPNAVLANIGIANDGVVTATFANGNQQQLGALAIAGFTAVEGLRPIGDSHWQATADSGIASIGQAGSGPLGAVRSSTLESANVDITEELVALIAAQRNFQANAQAIETANNMTQTIVNLQV